MGDRVGEGQSTETVVGGNDPHRGHGRVCEGGVRQGEFSIVTQHGNDKYVVTSCMCKQLFP